MPLRHAHRGGLRASTIQSGSIAPRVISDIPNVPGRTPRGICEESRWAEGLGYRVRPRRSRPVPEARTRFICETPDGQKGFCYETCVPDEPNPCPPGTYLEYVCDEMGCYEVCVDFPQECPEGQIPVTYCDDDNGCYTVCEDQNGGGEPDPGQDPDQP